MKTELEIKKAIGTLRLADIASAIGDSAERNELEKYIAIAGTALQWAIDDPQGVEQFNKVLGASATLYERLVDALGDKLDDMIEEVLKEYGANKPSDKPSVN